MSSRRNQEPQTKGTSNRVAEITPLSPSVDAEAYQSHRLHEREARIAEPQKHSAKIAIIGLKKSGKSTFLTVLHYALVKRGSRWRIRPLDKRTIREINRLTKRLFEQRLYPPSTAAGEGRIPDMRFHVERESILLGLGEGTRFELVAADLPGDAVLGISGEKEFHGFYEEYVKGCAAIIFLIDPQEKWLEDVTRDPYADYYYSVFNSILAELGAQGSQRIHAAFCITKLDKEEDTPSSFSEDGYYDLLKLEAKAAEILGDGTKATIDQSFRRVKWYAVSATGYYQDEDGTYRSQFVVRHAPGESNEQPGIVRPRDLTPIGVVEVAEYVFNLIAAEQIHSRDIERSQQIARKGCGKVLGEFTNMIRGLFG